MKNKVIKISVLLLLVVALVVTFGLKQGYYAHFPYQTRSLHFRLPIPPDVCRSFKVKPNPEVVRVFVSGSFNGWKSDDPDFEMHKKGQDWVLDLDLGFSTYKFVAYIKGKQYPVWVYDVSNPNKIPDGFDGYNSIFRKPLSIDVFQFMYSISLLLFIGYLFYLGLDQFSHRLKNFPTELTILILGMVMIFGLLTQIDSFYFTNVQKQNVLKRAKLIQSLVLKNQTLRIPGVWILDRNWNFTDSGSHSNFIKTGIQTLLGIPLKTVPVVLDSTFVELNGSKGSKKRLLIVPIKEEVHLKSYLVFELPQQGHFFKFLIFNAIACLGAILFVLMHQRKSSHSFEHGRLGSDFYSEYNITQREKDIIALLIKGSNNHEIASRLFISEKTVKSHIYNVYRKVGVQNRVELVNKIYGTED